MGISSNLKALIGRQRIENLMYLYAKFHIHVNLDHGIYRFKGLGSPQITYPKCKGGAAKDGEVTRGQVWGLISILSSLSSFISCGDRARGFRGREICEEAGAVI